MSNCPAAPTKGGERKALGEALTANDARQWLRRMSTGPAGPALLLAIDDVEPDTPMAVDLEELASLRPGNKLNVILTTDRAERLVKGSNGRSQTAVGVRAEIIEIGPLGLEEFRKAQQTLANHKVHFQQGAEYAEDYRAPWVLRTIYDDAARNPRHQDPNSALLLPPALGLELVDAARQNYAGQADLLRGYRVLARCTLADEGARSAELALAAANGFVVRQDALSDEARLAVAELKSKGAVRTYRHQRDRAEHDNPRRTSRDRHHRGPAGGGFRNRDGCGAGGP